MMPSDPPKPRKRDALLKTFQKVISPISRSGSPQPPTLPDTDTANVIAQPPGLARNKSKHTISSKSDVVKKSGSVAWKGLETALRLLEKSADVFPPLKSAVGGLVACLDLIQV